jgi:hypothetical protein
VIGQGHSNLHEYTVTQTGIPGYSRTSEPFGGGIAIL